jgi:hypothetical protein
MVDSCSHPRLQARNLAELLPVYECERCRGKFVCECEATWFQRYDPQRLQLRLREARIAEKVCVKCRHLPDILVGYRRSGFSSRRWRDIDKRHIELLVRDKARLQPLRAEAEAEERRLAQILRDDFIHNRYERILRKPGPPGTPLVEIQDERHRKRQEIANWIDVRHRLLQELHKGEVILSGEKLVQLHLFAKCHAEYSAALHELEREAENSVRREAQVPLIGQGWITETELYNLVRELVYPDEVIQHARLPWLGRQHLDILVPEHRLAIEYMGEQHHEAVTRFGGEDGLRYRQSLDERKRMLCLENGIRLIYVSPEDEISSPAIEERISRFIIRRSG